MIDFTLSKKDRIICDILPNAFDCDVHYNQGNVVHVGLFKLVSVAGTKSSYVDSKSVRTAMPKVVYNIVTNQECKIVKWRDTETNMLSCYNL